MTPTDALAQLLRTAHLPAQALDGADLTGADPVAPSPSAGPSRPAFSLEHDPAKWEPVRR